jgi:DNA repair exonuclease SbcCD ATPase subunit
MTPVRVKLAGFLSYADERELSFDGSSLWLLSGPNGSGKSAVFDAITYALFGEHRGGKINSAELIHKEKTAFAVEFDFTLDGKLYRAKRTLRRAKKGNPAGTQQIFAYADGDWAAVPDTTKKVDFDAWVQSHVGLTFDTFTSSVLLLQGKAEKLLDSKPAGRAEVLAGIVDLARYQALYERAVAKRKEFEGQFAAVTEEAAGVPEVTAADAASAAAAIEAADAERVATTARVTALAEIEIEARRWQDAAARHAAALAAVQTADALLAEAPKIETAFARVAELRTVLPAIHLITTERAKVAEADRRTERYLKDREREKERQTAAERNTGVAKATRDKLKADLADHERKHGAAAAELRALAGVLEKARLADALDVELTRLGEELKSIPPDPKADVTAAQADVDRFAELARVVPILTRFHTERAELIHAAERQHEESRKVEEVRAAGERAKADAEAVSMKLKEASVARATAEKAATEAAVRLDQATAVLAEFAAQAGAANCRACGQPLTPAHFQEEMAKRTHDRDKAAKCHTEAENTRTTALAAESDLAAKDHAARENLDQLRDEFKDHSAAAKQAQAEVARHTRLCRDAYLELTTDFQKRIVAHPPENWANTSYPARNDLAEMAREADGLDAARRHLAAARAALEKWQALRVAADAKRATRAALADGLPADTATVREKHATAHATEAALAKAIQATRNGLEQAEREADVHARTAQSAIVALTEVTGKLGTEDAIRKQCRDAIERSAKGLPVDWQLRVEHAGLQDSFVLQGELDGAVAGGIEEKYKRLDVARGRRQVLVHQTAELVKEVEAFPPDHRRPPDEVRVELAAAKRAAEAAADAAHAARQVKVGLDARTAKRVELDAKRKALAAEVNHYGRLAGLLGRDRLQRFLVRTAERQIVDHANAVLDRLSGGQLRLVPAAESDPAGTADKALDLDAVNRAAGGDPIPVAFLSGSQRFRVAVALALGIGRYASRQHRPIESVILDEGFGCLDRVGRQTMIQELQALRGQLARVLVVSHQEEFADAFSHGYKFALEDGRTRTERFGG